MIHRVRSKALIPALVLQLALGVAGPAALYAHDEHFSAGVPGDPKKPFRIVAVTMSEGNGSMAYVPSVVDVKRGEQIKFVVTNKGLLVHEFVLADKEANLKHAALMQKYPEMEHDDPNAKTVQPGATVEILWRFSISGTFEFACLIPGHREAGMLGHVSVK